jgi:hypothetical protein
MVIELENAGYNDTLGTCVGGAFRCYGSGKAACGTGSPNYTDALDPYLCYLADHYAELNNWSSAINGYTDNNGTYSVNSDCPTGQACHPSEINYLALTGGQTDGCTVDNCVSGGEQYPYGGATNTNLFNQLTNAGIPWADYNEDMPQACDATPQDGTNDLYVGRHNPGVVYEDLVGSQCNNNDVTLPSTPANLATALDASGGPDFVFLTPDVADDAHGCGSAQSNGGGAGASYCNGGGTNGIVESMNNWLAPTSGSYVQSGSINGCVNPPSTYQCTPVVSTGQGWLPAILGSTWFTGSAPATVIITMDESDHPGSTNLVPMVVISNQTSEQGLGRISSVTPFSGGGSYSTLASIDTAYHLGILGPAPNLSGLDNFLCSGGSC